MPHNLHPVQDIKTEEPSHDEILVDNKIGDSIVAVDNTFMVADSQSGNPNGTNNAGKNGSPSGEDQSTSSHRIGLAKPTTALHPRTSTPTATQRVSPRLTASPGSSHPLESLPPDISEHRMLYKVKRFLSTLVQFGNDINAETGDKVKELVFNLVASTISVGEFHQVLQEVTNFPLRPFVLPFLKSNIPLLCRDATRVWESSFSNLLYPHKTILQFIRSKPNLIFDLQGVQSSTEMGDIFHSEANLYLASNIRKRRGSSSSSLEDSNDMMSPLKRPCKSGPAHRRQQHWVYPQPWRSNESSSALPSNSTDTDDEWKNIHVMLNCILGMVEKTKRALSILQQRNCSSKSNTSVGTSHSHPHQQQNPFIPKSLPSSAPSSYNPPHPSPSSSSSYTNNAEFISRFHPYLSQPVGEFLATTLRNTEERVVEVRRRTEEAVMEVKRIAMAELHRAVYMDERRTMDSVVAGERIKLERLFMEQNTSSKNKDNYYSSQPDEEHRLEKEDNEGNRTNCWNCGRPATETCSGCNLARYCSQFCQHKDWESHHRICGASKPNISAFGGKSDAIIENSKSHEKQRQHIRTTEAIDGITGEKKSSGPSDDANENTFESLEETPNSKSPDNK